MVAIETRYLSCACYIYYTFSVGRTQLSLVKVGTNLDSMGERGLFAQGDGVHEASNGGQGAGLAGWASRGNDTPPVTKRLEGDILLVVRGGAGTGLGGASHT